MILRLLNKSNKIPVKSTETGIIYSINDRLRVSARGTHWKVVEIDGKQLHDGDVVNIITVDREYCCTLIVEKDE